MIKTLNAAGAASIRTEFSVAQQEMNHEGHANALQGVGMSFVVHLLFFAVYSPLRLSAMMPGR